MNAVIYCRVSTEEQATEGYSLLAQEEACRIFATRHGYHVDRVFVEPGASAKTVNRPALQQLLTYCTKNHKSTNAVIVYKLDRLSRNMVDYTTLIACFSRLNMVLHSATEPLDESAAGKLMKNVIASLAQFDNDMKGERTKSGIRQALKEGRWPFHAPIGYKFGTTPDQKKVLVKSDEASLVVDLFSLFEKGVYKQSDIIDLMAKRGLKRKLTKQTLAYILRNPIYMALIKHRFLDEAVKGIHEALISEKTFFTVQALLDGRKPTATPRMRNHPDFPLRNFAQCPLCKKGLTGSWSTSQSGVKYPYYHCFRKGCATKPIKRLEIESAFIAFLDTLKPSEAALRLFKAILIDAWKEKKAGQLTEQHRLETAINELEARKQRIDDLMIRNTFDEETYRDQVSKIRQELMVRRLELNELTIDQNNLEACLNYCNAFLENPAKLWANADINTKQRFQNLVFPRGITFKAGVIETSAISPIFKLFQEKNGDESKLAPRAGLEPATFPLTAGRSTIELPRKKVRNNWGFIQFKPDFRQVGASS